MRVGLSALLACTFLLTYHAQNCDMAPTKFPSVNGTRVENFLASVEWQFDVHNIKQRVYCGLSLPPTSSPHHWLMLLSITLAVIVFYGVNGYVFVERTKFNERPVPGRIAKTKNQEDVEKLKGVPNTELKKIGEYIRVLVAPSMAEEVLWRAILLPSPATFGVARNNLMLQKWVIWVLVCSAAYGLLHPLIGHVLACLPEPFRRAGAPRVFLDWRFIVMLCGLTFSLDLAYYVTGVIVGIGYLWPCVIIHWMTVVIWLRYCWGGARLVLHDEESTYGNWCGTDENQSNITQGDYSRIDRDQEDAIPPSMVLVSFLAGHGILRPPRPNAAWQIWGDVASVLWMILCSGVVLRTGILQFNRAQHETQHNKILKLSDLVGFAILALEFIISAFIAWVPHHDYNYCDYVIKSYKMMRQIKSVVDFNLERIKTEGTDVGESDTREKKRLEETKRLLKKLNWEITLTKWCGAKDAFIGSFAAICTSLLVILSWMSRVDVGIEHEHIFQTWLGLSVAMFSFILSTIPLVVFTRIANMYVANAEIQLAYLSGHLEPPPDSDQLSRSEWNGMCARYLVLHHELKEISSKALPLFLIFNVCCLLDQVAIAAAVWMEPRSVGLVVVGFCLLFMQSSFLHAQTKVTKNAATLKDLALRAVDDQGSQIRDVMQFVTLVQAKPTGWYVGPVLADEAKLLGLVGVFVANGALKILSNLYKQS